MQAEIIVIGDEVLIGQTLDTNSHFIAGLLNQNGISVKQKRVIADERATILTALKGVDPETNLVFMTGGLGPTQDDITRNTLQEYFGGEWVYHEDVYENIVKLFNGFNRSPSEVHKNQAYVPSSARAIVNKMGTAPGMHFEKNGVHYFSTPGVPYETEYLVGERILPWIQENLQKGSVLHRTLLTHGVPESDLAERIADWEKSLPEYLKLAYLPSPGVVKLRLSSFIDDVVKAEREMEEQIAAVKDILGDVVYGEGSQTLEEVIGAMLKEQNASLSTAESCTGGYVAHLITSVAGSSDYFQGSVVSYSNEAKMEMLGVEQKALEVHGAVSEEVVKQMALGANSKFGTRYSIATSGVAGPGGGSAEKPVGTVWIAIATDGEVKARKYVFGRHRERNIRKSALMALDLLRKQIHKNR